MSGAIHKFALFTVGVPTDEEISSSALPGIYVIAGAVFLVACLVALGAGFIAFRQVTVGWPELIKWPTIIAASLFAGVAIYWLDHCLIVAGAGVTGLGWNLILLAGRLGLVLLISANFAHEIVLCQYEKPLNLARIELEREQQKKNHEEMALLNDVPALKMSEESASKRLSELYEQHDNLPEEIKSKFSVAATARSQAAEVWKRWRDSKETESEGSQVEKLHALAQKKSGEANRLVHQANQAKTEYIEKINSQIIAEENNYRNTQGKRAKAEETTKAMIAPRSEAIAESFASSTVNRVALEKLRRENPSIDTDILIKTLFFGFLELLPLLLKIIVGLNNPVFERIRLKLVSDAYYYRSQLYLEKIREKASHEALLTAEMSTILSESAITQAKARLHFCNFEELLEDCIQQGARVNNKKGMTSEMYEHFFRTANESFSMASGSADNIFMRKKAHQSG